MADEKTLTQADVDAAVAAAVAKVQDSIDKLTTKNEELIGENRKLKRGTEITPEAHQAEVDRADKAELRVKELDGQMKTLTKERDTAVKSLETEQAAARSYALEGEIASAISAGGVVPALVPAFTAMVKQQAKAELVDGKYAVTIGDKPAKDYVATFLGTEEGKHFKAAAANGGGGAGGGGGSGGGGKQVTRPEFDAMDQPARAAFSREGGKVVDATA